MVYIKSTCSVLESSGKCRVLIRKVPLKFLPEGAAAVIKLDTGQLWTQFRPTMLLLKSQKIFTMRGVAELCMNGF